MSLQGKYNYTRKKHLPKGHNGEKPLRLMSTSVNDKDLWNAFKRGDEKAFVAIYHLYFDDLIRFGTQYLPLEIVEDNVQDMFRLKSKARNSLSGF